MVGKPGQWQQYINSAFRSQIDEEFRKPRATRVTLDLINSIPRMPKIRLIGPKPPVSPPHDSRPPSPGPVSGKQAGKRRAPPGVNASLIDASAFPELTAPPEEDIQPPQAPNDRFSRIWPAVLPPEMDATSGHPRDADYLPLPETWESIISMETLEVSRKLALEAFPEPFHPVRLAITSCAESTYSENFILQSIRCTPCAKKEQPCVMSFKGVLDQGGNWNMRGFACEGCGGSDDLDGAAECDHGPCWTSGRPIRGKFAVFLAMHHQIVTKQRIAKGKQALVQPEYPDKWRTQILHSHQLPKDQPGVVITSQHVKDHPVPGPYPSPAKTALEQPLVAGKRRAPSPSQEDDRGEGPSQKRRRVSVQVVRSSSHEMEPSPAPDPSATAWVPYILQDNHEVTQEDWEELEEFEERKKVKLQLRNLRTAEQACRT